jgi:hypothetical protein
LLGLLATTNRNSIERSLVRLDLGGIDRGGRMDPYSCGAKPLKDLRTIK